MLETPSDRFAEWLSLPALRASSDPRFEVKQASQQDFERVFACVDESFGRRRPPALFDWLYRKNPYGLARAWYVEEKATGRILKSSANFPWPVYYGKTPRDGFFGGDSGTVPDWQRKGLTKIERGVKRTHPWDGERVQMGAPNHATLAVQKSEGRESSVRGMIPGGVVPLRGGALLQRASIPRLLANPLGTIVSGAVRLWQNVALDSARALRLEPLDAFSQDLNAVTWETTEFPHYWCPHNAEWLNWRYLNHPSETYSAFVLLDAVDDRPLGYSVLRFSGDNAALAEFAAGQDTAPSLLLHTLSVARSAGCSSLATFHPASWRHWPLFRRAGFLPYQTNHFFVGVDKQNEELSFDFNAWQITPGDRDVH